MHPHHPLSPPDHRARRLLRAAFTSWLIVAQSGCQSPTPKRIGPPSAAEAVRNNCYSLLHQLLDDEKNVSKILIIKRDRKELGDLIKEISAASRAGATKLEEFSKEDPSFPLQEYGLPPGENATREIGRAHV